MLNKAQRQIASEKQALVSLVCRSSH